MSKGAHDQRKQKLLDAFEAFWLEVKEPQQALNYDQSWVDQRLAEAKGESTKAQAALERFLREASALARMLGQSIMPERTPTTHKTPEALIHGERWEPAYAGCAEGCP